MPSLYRCFIIAVLFFTAFFTGCTTSGSTSDNTAAEVKDYHAVTLGDSVFLAVGDGGRIDILDPDTKTAESQKSPTMARLNAAAYANGRYYCVGSDGTILSSDSSQIAFKVEKSGVNVDLLSVAGLNGYVLAGGKNGTLLRSAGDGVWEKVPNDFNTDIISMASNGSRLFAITREGQIYNTTDCLDISVQDYTTEFRGFNQYDCYFGTISSLGGMFFITGSLQEDEDMPMSMMSDTGEVWQPRSLDEVNKVSITEYLPIRLGGVAMLNNEVVSPANGGRFYVMDDCHSCNRLEDSYLSSKMEVTAIAYNKDVVLVVGEDFTFEFLNVAEDKTDE